MFDFFVRPRFRLTMGWLFAAFIVLAAVGSARADDTGTGQAVYHPNPMLMGLDFLIIGVLSAASLTSIALIIDAFIHLRKSKIVPDHVTERIQSLIRARQFEELYDYTASSDSFVSKAVHAGLRRAKLGYNAMQEALESTAAEQSSNLFRRIEMLNVIGNIGPLLGLLGTVLGMIMAFMALHTNGGEANAADLSVGIATALWHTFFGLAVAIPSLIAFGFFRIRLDKIVNTATLLSEDLLESLRPTEGPSKPTGEPAKAAARPANQAELQPKGRE
ncbi:MAG TPA: MotA/TolQ/ExbB proton channel family protein [Phycisphaerae bacterium]|nr:MotA/TolQ/ExbB proton channel family protein [Phycisphaerae bacterium]